MPGFNRISFEHVTEDKVENILDSVLKLETPETEILGQFPKADSRSWDKVNSILRASIFLLNKKSCS